MVQDETQNEWRTVGEFEILGRKYEALAYDEPGGMVTILVRDDEGEVADWLVNEDRGGDEVSG